MRRPTVIEHEVPRVRRVYRWTLASIAAELPTAQTSLSGLGGRAIGGGDTRKPDPVHSPKQTALGHVMRTFRHTNRRGTGHAWHSRGLASVDDQRLDGWASWKDSAPYPILPASFALTMRPRRECWR